MWIHPFKEVCMSPFFHPLLHDFCFLWIYELIKIYFAMLKWWHDKEQVHRQCSTYLQRGNFFIYFLMNSWKITKLSCQFDF